MRSLKKRKKGIVGLLLTLLLLCSSSTALAAVDCASLDFHKTGSITITLDSVTDGALTLYPVAVLYLDDGNMAYAYTEAFQGCTASLADVTDAALGSTLAAYVEEEGVAGTEKTIGTNGQVTFRGLSLGLYLVTQTTKSTGYYEIEPFLVTVPLEKNDAWSYAVDASPKVEVEAEPYVETPKDTTEGTKTTAKAGTKLPQTGQLNWPIPVLAASGLLLFSMGWYLTYVDKRRKQHEG